MSIKQFAPILDAFSIGSNSVVYQDSQTQEQTLQIAKRKPVTSLAR